MRQRLVGAAVLIAIGIIAWSVIFDPSQVDRFSKRSQIAPAPQFEKFDIELDPRPSGLRSIDYQVRNLEQYQQQSAAQSAAEQAGAAAAPAAPAATEKAPEPAHGPELDTFGLPKMWAVQVGSFGKAENAMELKQALEKAGYHVIVQNVDAERNRLTRLFVDPKLDRSGAERLRQRVNGQFGTEAMVVRYYPG